MRLGFVLLLWSQGLHSDSYRNRENWVKKTLMPQDYKSSGAGISKKVIMVADFIAENITNINIRGVENSNNILTDIPQADKESIRNAFRRIVKDYEYQPNSLIEVFG